MNQKPNRVLTNATRAVEVLALNGPLTPAEIAERIGIARSSAYRMADALVETGLAEPVDGSSVRLTRRWLQLADASTAQLTEWAGAQPRLEAIARRTRLTAYLTVLEGEHAICIAWAQGSGIDLLQLSPGRQLPLNAGAAGKCFLAFDRRFSDASIELREISTFTEFTLVDPESLKADIEATRQRGYSLSDEDVTLGVGAIGIPLYRSGELVGCLSLAGVTEQVQHNHEELYRELKAIAEELTTGSPSVD